VCEAKTFKLPLNLGSVTWGGLECPVAAGTLSVPIGVKFSSLVPAALAKGTVAASATTSTGDKLVCLTADLKRLAVQTPPVTGGTVGITWEDCGDSSTHGKIKDLQPSSFTIGDDVTLMGTGILDKDIDGGNFAIHVEAAGFIKEDWAGDVCEAKTFKLPLNLGSVTWVGLECPVAAGTLSVPIGLKFASVVPAALAKGKVSASATSTTGDKLVCLTADLKRAALLV